MIRLYQPILVEVGAGPELGNIQLRLSLSNFKDFLFELRSVQDTSKGCRELLCMNKGEISIPHFMIIRISILILLESIHCHLLSKELHIILYFYWLTSDKNTVHYCTVDTNKRLKVFLVI